MNINTKTTNLSLTPDIDSYLTKKLSSLKNIIDFDADNVFAQVELAKTTNHHKSGEIYKAEITVRFDGHNVRVSCENEDLLAAIDELKDELSQEIKSKKEKSRESARKGGAQIKDIVREPDSE